ncbi:adhesin [Zestomonas thermotolerans]|uniref:adhesin n=1 Tax=Zestomonas thermotolerans TaxID=157784 RepID=UPI0023F44F47|nr:adhesin [Pseudomonas thermotolerans]
MKRLILLLGVALPTLALADGLHSQNTASLTASGSGYSGVMSINQAAGDLHQQINGRALAIGEQAGAKLRYRQSNNAELPVVPLDATASINGSAFSRGAGVLGVNQSAGVGNQQINAFRTSISTRGESLDDSVLAQQSVALPKSSGPAGSEAGRRIVNTDDRAFAGSSGVVQLNQSAGVGNRTVNTFSIRVAD